jgi:hypothetical protein
MQACTGLLPDGISHNFQGAGTIVAQQELRGLEQQAQCSGCRSVQSDADVDESMVRTIVFY